MKRDLEFITLSGADARHYVNDLANLRLKVFYEFPYLYEGTLKYEVNYLETYFKAKNSFILLVKDGEKVVGATTGIKATEEEDSFRKPFIDYGLDVSRIFYFGESILLPEYRGEGIGKIFFSERERFARSIPGIEILSFCAVVRNNPPEGYRPLDDFWKAQGFQKQIGLTTEYEWPDRGQQISTKKLMQFWTKNI